MENPRWDHQDKLLSLRKWSTHLQVEAQRLFSKDGTHGNMLFLFDEKKGLVSVNLIPPKVEHNEINIFIKNAVSEHHFYGVVFIGEAWAYFIKQNDHTAVQLLDGEMCVSDLNDEDKREILLVRMENRDGECFVSWNEIERDKKGASLGKGKKTSNEQRNWF